MLISARQLKDAAEAGRGSRYRSEFEKVLVTLPEFSDYAGVTSGLVRFSAKWYVPTGHPVVDSGEFEPDRDVPADRALVLWDGARQRAVGSSSA